jgi:hypothetical protein
VSPLPQGRGRDPLKKRKEIEVSVPARIAKSPAKKKVIPLKQQKQSDKQVN